MNLGKQTVKRPVRAIRHSGVRQGIREGRKAFSYYAKSTKKYYAKKVGFSSRKDLFISSISTLLSKGIDCFRHRR